MMALLLLLVATVVSIVIVTVALTSTMHVTDNKTSQQEYLACVSAAEMLRDGLAGSTYTYTVKSGTFTYRNKVRKYGTYGSYEEREFTEETGTITTPDTKAKNEKFEHFVTKISEAIRNGSLWRTTSGKFEVQQSDVNGTNPVECDYKITEVDEGKQYNLKIRLSYKMNEDSEGYRMTLKIPITVNTDTLPSTKELIECKLSKSEVQNLYNDTYRKQHRNVTIQSFYGITWENINYDSKIEHEFDMTGTVTTVSWGETSAPDLKISKGWDAYEN